MIETYLGPSNVIFLDSVTCFLKIFFIETDQQLLSDKFALEIFILSSCSQHKALSMVYIESVCIKGKKTPRDAQLWV